ncbi:MAG: lysozyme [Leptolyngbya sp. SIO3F4]|nr:lysozyme [Leptolyngbya sp. SIO3F4]
MFPDGKVYEMEGTHALRIHETDNEVNALAEVLRTTNADKFSIADPKRSHPAITSQTDSLVPQAAIDLIKRFEGYERKLNDGTDRVKAYPDPGPRGWSLPTIGYGTTYYPDGRQVQQNDIITREESERFLIHEVEEKCRLALETIPTWGQMNPNQRAALYSFAYNLGAGFYGSQGFQSITAVCDSPRKWNDKQWVAEQFGKYVRSNNEVLPGLVRRRAAEAQLFCKFVGQSSTANVANIIKTDEIKLYTEQIGAINVSQPNESLCQSACIAMCVTDTDVWGIRTRLKKAGIPGDPNVMARIIREYPVDYELHLNACLDDCEQWLKDGDCLITHGWFTESGHVIVLDGIEVDLKTMSYRFDVKDPFSEFFGSSWRYGESDEVFYDGFYSKEMIYASCVASRDVSEAKHIYAQKEFDGSRKGMWVHRFRAAK